MKVTVLLSTYNGEKFLREQLDSLLQQHDVEVNILVRDDGSTDGTKQILQEYNNQGSLTWYTGDNLKPAMSFVDLMFNAPNSDYYAFCDQDDVWMTDKLSVALSQLEINGADFYYSSYTTVDADLNIIKENVQHHHSDSLGASLVNLEVTGCTIVFSKRLLDAVRHYHPYRIMMHDSWVYKIALALDYKVVYDPLSHIYYRQHGSNVIGDKKSFIDKMKSRYNRWVKDVSNNRYYEVMELINGYKNIMPETQKKVLEPLANYIGKSLYNRFLIAIKPIYRTDIAKTDFYFFLSLIFKRF